MTFLPSGLLSFCVRCHIWGLLPIKSKCESLLRLIGSRKYLNTLVIPQNISFQLLGLGQLLLIETLFSIRDSICAAPPLPPVWEQFSLTLKCMEFIKTEEANYWIIWQVIPDCDNEKEFVVEQQNVPWLWFFFCLFVLW